jgi:hypothetical protein
LLDLAITADGGGCLPRELANVTESTLPKAEAAMQSGTITATKALFPKTFVEALDSETSLGLK